MVKITEAGIKKRDGRFFSISKSSARIFTLLAKTFLFVFVSFTFLPVGFVLFEEFDDAVLKGTDINIGRILDSILPILGIGIIPSVAVIFGWMTIDKDWANTEEDDSFQISAETEEMVQELIQTQEALSEQEPMIENALGSLIRAIRFQDDRAVEEMKRILSRGTPAEILKETANKRVLDYLGISQQ